MRFAALALLVATVAGAGGRVTDRACDVSSRRSSRGGVACVASGVAAGSIAMVGHSILLGISPLLVPTEVGTLTGRNTPTTLAVGGSRVADCVTRFNASVGSVASYTTLVWQCAVNDIIDGTDGATIWNATVIALDAAVAAGKYVVINSETPCGVSPCSTDNQNTNLLYYNARANAWAIENGASARYAANYQWFVVTDGGNQLATEHNSGDGLHLVDGGTAADGGYLGSDLLARLTAAAIDAGPIGAQAGGELVRIGSAGMGAVCADAVITTDDGGAVTTTRAGTAYCSKKGYANVGIANGDLVLVSANRPRIEAGYDGGTRIRREAAGTNETDHPLDLGHANWATQGVVVAAPTVTQNGCTAPDGTMTGTRLQMPATGAAEASIIYNLTGIVAGAGKSTSLYCRDISGTSGPIDHCAYDASTSNHCFTCTPVSGSWTRGVLNNFTQSDVGTSLVVVGNAGFYNGGTARLANDVCVWGAQAEVSETATSLMPATRGAETITADFTASGNFVSYAATFDAPAVRKAGRTWLQAYFDASNDNKGYTSATIGTCDFRQATVSHTADSTTTVTAGAGNRMSCAYVASVFRSCVRGVCTYPAPATALTLPTGAGTLYVGGRSAAGTELNGLIGDISLSTTSTGSQ